MAHTQKADFVFRRNGRVYLNRRGRQFSRLLAAEVCASAVVMLDTPFSEVEWRVLATHSIRQFLLHFPSPTSPCAITFQLHFTWLQTFRDNLTVPSLQVKWCLFFWFFLLYFHLPFNLCRWPVLKTPGLDAACEILKCGMICQWGLTWSNDVRNLNRGVSRSWQEAKLLTFQIN
jgi:hypothetical protein